MAINDGRRVKATAAFLALTLVALGSCGSRPDPSTPGGAAARFLDAYFGLDLDAALAASVHRARERVEAERRLTAGQRVDAETRVPIIRYRLLREEPGEGTMVHLVYEVRATVPDAGTSEQRWLVTVDRIGERWIVADFDRLPG